MKAASNLYNFFLKVRIRQDIKIFFDYYYELSLSKSDDINNFLSIIAILSIAITTSFTTILIYVYGKRIILLLHELFIENLHLHCTSFLALVVRLSQLVGFLNLLVSNPIVHN